MPYYIIDNLSLTDIFPAFPLKPGSRIVLPNSRGGATGLAAPAQKQEIIGFRWPVLQPYCSYVATKQCTIMSTFHATRENSYPYNCILLRYAERRKR